MFSTQSNCDDHKNMVRLLSYYGFVFYLNVNVRPRSNYDQRENNMVRRQLYNDFVFNKCDILL